MNREMQKPGFKCEPALVPIGISSNRAQECKWVPMSCQGCMMNWWKGERGGDNLASIQIQGEVVIFLVAL